MDEIIVIDLFGEEFRFKPDKQVEHPEQVAAELRQYIKDAEKLFQNTTSGKNKTALLLLAAMNISKDFHELKIKHSRLEQEMENRLSSLNAKIDRGIN